MQFIFGFLTRMVVLSHKQNQIVRLVTPRLHLCQLATFYRQQKYITEEWNQVIGKIRSKHL